MQGPKWNRLLHMGCSKRCLLHHGATTSASFRLPFALVAVLVDGIQTFFLAVLLSAIRRYFIGPLSAPYWLVYGHHCDELIDVEEFLSNLFDLHHFIMAIW